MDWRRWTRNAQAVHAALQEAPDGSVVTKRRAAIYIPERYTEHDLASIAADIYIVGIFAIVIDDSVYAVSNVCAMMRICPTAIATVKLDDSNYLEFTFDPGSVVFADTQLVRNSDIPYNIFDEFISKGKIPWFIDYRRDIGNLLETANEFAGVNFSNSHAVFDIISATITRKESDPHEFYRYAVTTDQDLAKVEAVSVPLRSVTYGATDTTTKLVGAYFGEGLDSALVNPSESVEQVESILRM